MSAPANIEPVSSSESSNYDKEKSFESENRKSEVNRNSLNLPRNTITLKNDKKNNQIEFAQKNEMEQQENDKNGDNEENLEELLNKYNDYEMVLKQLKKYFNKRWNKSIPSELYFPKRFNVYSSIGSGTFGKVKLVRDEKTGKFYALKCISKHDTVKYKQTFNVYTEKQVLYSVRFPFLVHSTLSLKDNEYIYFALPFLNGGDLYNYHRKCRTFNEKKAKFYAAQVFLALEYLHYIDLIYRDLKPENILMDDKGYLKLTDYGFCKKIEGRTWTVCGTPEYLAPELIDSKPYGFSVDWWAFGVLIYELVAGYSPFISLENDHVEIYEKVRRLDYKIPMTFSKYLKDLVQNLLQKDITRRFGNLKNGCNDIKDHQWFKGTNWKKLLLQEMEPPYIPKVKGPGDLTYFKHNQMMLNFENKHLGRKKSPTQYNSKVFQDF